MFALVQHVLIANEEYDTESHVIIGIYDNARTAKEAAKILNDDHELHHSVQYVPHNCVVADYAMPFRDDWQHVRPCPHQFSGLQIQWLNDGSCYNPAVNDDVMIKHENRIWVNNGPAAQNYKNSLQRKIVNKLSRNDHRQLMQLRNQHLQQYATDRHREFTASETRKIMVSYGFSDKDIQFFLAPFLSNCPHCNLYV